MMDNNNVINSYEIDSINKAVFNLPQSIIEALEGMGVSIDDNYISYLQMHSNPKIAFDNQQLSYIAKCDYYNKLLFSKSKGLGDIYEYNEFGSIINHYSSVIDAAKGSMPKSVFGFEKLDNQRKKPTVNHDLAFYGKRFENYICNDASVYSLLFKSLNKTIRKVKYYLYDSKPSQTNLAMYYSFIEAHTLHLLLHNSSSDKKANRQKLSYKEYAAALLPLKNRYSYKHDDLFFPVKDLNDFDRPGIYILCFDEYRGYYIGQAKTSIMQRIIQHFKKPNSSFDIMYGANEVSAIYAMPYVKNEILMDELEADCISMIFHKYLLNDSADSGKSLTSIHDDSYNPQNYRMNLLKHKQAIDRIRKLKQSIS